MRHRPRAVVSLDGRLLVPALGELLLRLALRISGGLREICETAVGGRLIPPSRLLSLRIAHHSAADGHDGSKGQTGPPTCPARVFRLDAAVVVLVAVQERVPPPYRRQAQPAEKLAPLEGVDEVSRVAEGGAGEGGG
jgi:hypothetical protein